MVICTADLSPRSIWWELGGESAVPFDRRSVLPQADGIIPAERNTALFMLITSGRTSATLFQSIMYPDELPERSARKCMPPHCSAKTITKETKNTVQIKPVKLAVKNRCLILRWRDFLLAHVIAPRSESRG